MGDYYSDEKIASRNDSRNRFATFRLHDNKPKPKPKPNKNFAYDEHNLATNSLGDFRDLMKRKARDEASMKKAARILASMKKTKGGKVKVYTGPKNGKYIIKNGSKIYINCK
jgi:hypothetical protein